MVATLIISLILLTVVLGIIGVKSVSKVTNSSSNIHINRSSNDDYKFHIAR